MKYEMCYLRSIWIWTVTIRWIWIHSWMYCTRIACIVWWIIKSWNMCGWWTIVWTLHTTTTTKITIFKHLFIMWTYYSVFNFNSAYFWWCNYYLILILTAVQRPIIAFFLSATLTCHFDETFIQTEIMTNWILPSFFILLEIRKIGHNIRVNFIQCSTTLWWMLFVMKGKKKHKKIYI